MMTLYGMTDSGNCYKPRLLLAKLGRPFRHVEVSSRDGGTKSAEFLAKNPNAMVPLLEFDDGRTLAESNAMLLHLERDEVRLNHSVCRLARRSTRKDAKDGLVARPSGLTTWASAKRKPGGPGWFGPNPSAFVSAGQPVRLSTKPSTLSQTIAGRMVQSDLISL